MISLHRKIIPGIGEKHIIELQIYLILNFTATKSRYFLTIEIQIGNLEMEQSLRLQKTFFSALFSYALKTEFHRNSFQRSFHKKTFYKKLLKS